MTTTQPGKTAFKVQRVIAARFQAIEQLLDLADLVQEHDEVGALLQRQIAQQDFARLTEFAEAYTDHMSPWQQESLRDQMSNLNTRFTTTTEEN